MVTVWSLFRLVFAAAGGAAVAFGMPTAAAPQPPDPITTKDLLQVAQISTMSVSPNGVWIAYQVRRLNITDNRYDLSWYLARADRSVAPVPIGLGGSPEPFIPPGYPTVGEFLARPARWAPDSNHLIVPVFEDGAIRLWVANTAGDSPVKVTDGQHAIRAYGWTAPDTLVYSTDRTSLSDLQAAREAEARSGFVLDDRFIPLNSVMPLIDGIPPGYGELSVKLKPEWSGDARIWSVNVPSKDNSAGQRVAAAPYTRPTVATDDPEVLGTAEFRSRCRHALCEEIRRPRFVGNTSQGAIVLADTNLQQGRALWLLKGNGGAPRPFFTYTGLLENCSVRDDHVFCLGQSSRKPAYILEVDLRGRANVIVDENQKLSARLHNFRIERRVWTNRYGISNFGDLVFPQNYDPRRKYPLVVVTYRSLGFLKGGVGDEFPIFPLASQGNFVLSFDRGYPEGEISSANNGQEWGTKIQDSVLDSLRTALRDIEINYPMKRERVILTGLSAGTELVHHALFRLNMPICAVSIASSSADPSNYYGSGAFSQILLRSKGLGRPGTDSASHWPQYSSALNASRIQAPVLMQVADSELNGAMEFITTLRELGKPIDVYVFPNENHVKNIPAHKLAVYERNMRWVAFWGGGNPAHGPEFAAERARWEKMRQTRSDGGKVCASVSSD